MKGVSFIICTYNGKYSIQRAIECVVKQVCTFPFELIVVDNCSNEENKNYYQILKEKYDFILSEEMVQGLLFARKRGVASAKYPYITFIDDDNYIIGNWTDKIIEIFEEHPTAGVIGSYNEPVFDSKPPEWFAKFQSCYAAGHQWHTSEFIDPEIKNYIWGAGMCARKTLWEKFFNQYNDSLHQLPGRKAQYLTSGEDGWFCQFVLNNSYKLYYSADLKLQHFIARHRLQPEYLFRINYFFGKSQSILAKNESTLTKVKVLLRYCCFFLLKTIFPHQIEYHVNYYYLKGYIF